MLVLDSNRTTWNLLRNFIFLFWGKRAIESMTQIWRNHSKRKEKVDGTSRRNVE